MMQKKKRKIAIVGPYPPPYGGISVHIQRVLEYLPSDSIALYNSNKSYCEKAVPFYGQIKFLKVFIFLFKKYFLIHTHSTDPVLRILFGIIGIFRKNIYLHLHGDSLTDYLDKNHLGSRIMKRLVRNLNILACNSILVDKIKLFKPIKVMEIDAFIPPKFNQEIFDMTLMPYKNFMQEKRFIISMNGWFDYYNNEDLYGFDLSVRVINKFIEQGKEIYLVASINGIRNKDLYNSIIQFINDHSLQDHILLIHEDLPEIWPIFMASQLFIRPTNSDGSSVSIKEALWLETPVIASDCIVRPEGVTLFKNRKWTDLYDKMLYFYEKPYLTISEKKESVKRKTFTNNLFSEVYEL
jgi:glycosyltransferase involved in cell wall biosynthesis